MADTAPLNLLGGLSEADQEHKNALDYLTTALANRNGNSMQQTLLAISQGMLTPGPTGSFGESVGHAAGNVLKLQKEQEASGIENAKMRLQIAQAQRQAAQEKATSEGLAGLYKTGEAGLEFQPEVAMKLAQITRDPKFVQMAYEQDKQQRMQKAGRTVFTPVTTTDEKGQQKTSYQFNPDSVFALAQASTDPMETIAKYADMVPKLRKAGMLKDLQGDITTPFDAIALMAANLGAAGPAYAEQAKRLAKQYQSGLIDDDKANTLANQMMQTLTASMDRQSQLQNTQVMQQFQRMLATQQFQLNQEKLEERRKEDDKKLTDEQKSVLNKIIIPIVNQSVNGNNALLQIQTLKSVIEDAPSNAFTGAFAASAGKLFNTDEGTALRRLESLSKSLIPMIPRLPGAASNLDANNLEKSIGNLSNPLLSNEARRTLINDVYTQLKNLTDRAEAVQEHWEKYKKYDPKLLEPKGKDTPPKPVGTPSPAGGVNLRWNPATKQFE